MGFQYVPALLVPQMCFQKRRAIAVAITLSGCPIGSFLFSPFMQYLINMYGWRGALQITGAFILHGCAFGLMLIPPKKLPETTSHEEEFIKKSEELTCVHSTDKSIGINMVKVESKVYETIKKKLRTVFDVSALNGSDICIVFLQWVLFCLGMPVIFTFFPLVSSNYGVTKDAASFMLSVFGFSEFSGRLSYGGLGSFKKMNSVYLWCLTSTISGVSYLIMAWTKTIPLIYVLLVLLGVTSGKFEQILQTKRNVFQ